MKILLFAPEAGVAPFYLSHMLTAYGLSLREHDVTVVSCLGSLSRCPVLDMHQLSGVDPRRRSACESCRKVCRLGSTQFQQKSIPIDAYLDQPLLKEIADSLDELNGELESFEFDGQPFGRAALHSLTLATKKTEIDLYDAQDFQLWREFILGGVASYTGVQEILCEGGYDALIHLNQYIYQVGALLAARSLNIKHYTIRQPSHRGFDYRRLTIVLNGTGRTLPPQQRSLWPHVHNLPLSTESISEIYLDILTRLGLGGSHVFSPKRKESPVALRARLGIRPQSKVIVAFTSSPDERQASLNLANVIGGLERDDAVDVFPDQITWLKELTAWVAEQNKITQQNLHLVVRVHPRLSENKGVRKRAAYLDTLKDTFSETSDDITIVWSEDSTSSYDLGELADLALVSWSSVGLELSRLGVPVVRTNAEGISLYPRTGIFEFEETSGGYFNLIEEALEREPRMSDFIEAFRWYYCVYLSHAVVLDEVSPSPSFQGFPEPRDSVQYDALERVIVGGETPSDINYAALRDQQTESSEYLEMASLCANLGRLFIFLATNRDPGRAVFLSVDGKQCIVGQSEGSVELLPGRNIRLTFEGEVVERFSPMLSRFVPALLEGYARLDARYGKARATSYSPARV